MSRPDDQEPEDGFTTWLAACDDALAAGTPPPAGEPLNQDRGHDHLACAKLLRRVLGDSTSTGLGFRVESAPVGVLPWTHLGRFQLLRELGRGGCGIVYLAYDPHINREVALKVSHVQSAIDPEWRSRFMREAHAAGCLDHPNVVPVHEAGAVGPVEFIVSAYCPGPTLADWLRKRTEPIPFRDAAGLIAVLADAVAHAHARGVLHRDLKPANILLSTNNANQHEPCGSTICAYSGDSWMNLVPKITDFGLAKQLDSTGEAPTRTGMILGTVNYMAPEQAAGRSEAIGIGADIYALGAMLYELLTSRPPLMGETDLETLGLLQKVDPVTPSRLRPRTPRDLETICLTCLHKEPHRRYASAAELRDDLHRYLEDRPIHARRVSRVEIAGRWCRRNPALATACLFAAAALIGVVVLSLSLAYQQSRAAIAIGGRERETRAALEAVREQSILTRRETAVRALDQGLTECEAGHGRNGILTLARSLTVAAELPPKQIADVDHAARVNLTAWRAELPGLIDLFQHDAVIRVAAFSPDGSELTTASADGVLRRWNSTSRDQLGPNRLYPGVPNCLDYSPDGKLIAVGGARGVQILQAAGGVILRDVAVDEYVFGLAFSPEGRVLLTGGNANRARIWDVESGAETGAIPVPSLIRAVCFTRNGSVALLGCNDGEVRFWDMASRKLLPRDVKHHLAIMSMAVSPDGTLLATGSHDESASMWSLPDGKQKHRFLLQGPVSALAFHPRQELLATSARSQVSFRDTQTGRLVGERLIHEAGITTLAIHPTGRSILAGGDDSTVRMWELVVGRESGHLLAHGKGANTNVTAFSPDNRRLLTAGAGALPCLWDAETGAKVRTLEGPTGPISSASLSPDGRTAAAGGEDQVVWLWDTADGRLRPLPRRHETVIRVVTFSPTEADLLLSVDGNGVGFLWNIASCEVMREFRFPGTVKSWAAAISPDGRRLAIGGSLGRPSLHPTGLTRVWDLATGRLLHEFHLEHGVDAVAFSRDSEWIAAGDELSAHVWNAETGRPLKSAFPHRAAVRCVDFSPDGSRLLTGSLDHTARVREVAGGRLIGTPASHGGLIRDAAFSPDGALFATASFDHTGRLWDVATGKPVGPAVKFDYWVVNVAFRNDGRAVAFAGGDGTARLCNVPIPVSGSAERVRLWAETTTGAELEGDVMRMLDGPTLQERRRRLQELDLATR
jgi:WD40 repeat protein